MDRFVTVTPRVVDIVIGSNTRQTTIPRSTDKSTKSSKPRLKTKTTTTSPQPLFRPLVTELYEPSAKHINEKIQHILENVYHFKKFKYISFISFLHFSAYPNSFYFLLSLIILYLFNTIFFIVFSFFFFVSSHFFISF